MKEKISAVYQIKNIMTGERYVGSSKDVKHRWANHKCQSLWERCPNKKLYQDMQEYGIENFIFAILAPVEPEHLKQVEQEFIDMLKPEYNNIRSNGWDVERQKASVRTSVKKYRSQLCFYNGKTMTLCALIHRLQRAGIPHPNIEAKKYIIKGE